MRTIIIGDDNFEKTQILIKSVKYQFRRIIVIGDTDIPEADNQFKNIPVDILERAVDLCNHYSTIEFPFLFVFHSMDMELKYNCKPIYADFFQKAQWIVSTRFSKDLPSFITNNATKN